MGCRRLESAARNLLMFDAARYARESTRLNESISGRVLEIVAGQESISFRCWAMCGRQLRFLYRPPPAMRAPARDLRSLPFVSSKQERWCRMRVTLLAVLLVVIGESDGQAADVTVRQVASALYAAPPGRRVDFSNRDLSYLDLSNLNFKSALLARSDLFGSDVSNSDLTNVNLSGSRLDRTTVIRTNFSGADLTGATMMVPAAFIDPITAHSDAPKFTGATLIRLRATGVYWQVDFRGADLTNADFSPHAKRFGDTTVNEPLRTSLRSCDFFQAREWCEQTCAASWRIFQCSRVLT